MKITFYFVRHGETLFNMKSRVQGVSDSPLTERGISQARQAAKSLEKVYFDKAFCSPAERCLDTAEIILEGRKMEPEIIDTLHEVDFGRFEGTRFTSHADEIRACFEKKDFSSVGGESDQDAGRRVYELMDALLTKCDSQDQVLIVSHGYLEGFLMQVILGVDVDKLEKEMNKKNKNMIPNAGIMVFTYEDGVYSVTNLPAYPDEWTETKTDKTVHFYYVRHGETLFNQWNRMQGACDSPLTEKGIHQAQAAAAALKDIPFAEIYTSTAQRARETAGILSYGRNTKPIMSKNLKEVNFGDFEGSVRDSWIDEIKQRHMHEDWSDVGGENGEQIKERQFKILDKITSSAKDGENILLVSHGTYYMNLLRNLFHMERSEVEEKLRAEGKQPMPNGGIFRFDSVNGEYKLVSLMEAPEEFNK